MTEQATSAQTARRQLAAAIAIVAQHQPLSSQLCSCGRELPCTVALACARTTEHHAGVLAMLHTTVELPLIDAGGQRRPWLLPHQTAHRN